MGNKLLVVESPAKAKTIGKYLGGEFSVKSSVGHIRDLPTDNDAIKIVPAGEGKWTFTPKYVVSKGKEKVVSELKAAAKKADEIYLASDPDREGEAIAWHLKEVLGPVAGKKPFRRVTYNEITRPAVVKAIAEPRDIDMPRVDAQQARRILDRLVGYEVSSLLWKNIPCANSRSLSAGRVQSVALRLLVERQREIDAFKPEAYYLLGVEAAKRDAARASFVARLARVDDAKPEVKSREAADAMIKDLEGASLEVADLKSQPKVRRPLPPFTTSTLQQAASSVLGMSPGKTMKTAQALYEQGLITYMRTDSVNVSEIARAAARDYIRDTYGEAFRPEKPNIYRSKADAQGAHEAIRPTDVTLAGPASGLDGSDLKLYDLIWRRFIASQMSEAKTVVRTAYIKPVKQQLAHSYVFTASATDIEFEGFLKVMRLSLSPKRADGEDDEDTDEVAELPALSQGEGLDVVKWIADEKMTKGPSHYSEASLIKALEENGVGRPSTYAATIETLKAREYAKTEKRKLIPLERGVMVCDWLVKNLNELFNVGYTAEMESELDKVEECGEPMNAMLSDFYAGFRKALERCKPPPPDESKFDAVFAMLDEVKEWREPQKVGKRTYDDKAFVESVKKQRDGGRPLSARQLDFLARMVSRYAAQIHDADARLRAAGVAAAEGARASAEAADESLVRLCFETLDRAGGREGNSFLKSLRDQVSRGRSLSPRQFAVLARYAGVDAAGLPDGEEIRERLSKYVPGGFGSKEGDPSAPGLLKLLSEVKNWHEPAKKGKRTYDDKAFVDSLAEQFARRKMLSERQAAALRRMVSVYRAEIPDVEEKAKALGIELKAPRSAGRASGGARRRASGAKRGAKGGGRRA